MATESVSDEWMYNEVLDDDMPEVSGMNRRVSIDSTDLLDDVLTFPASGGGNGSKTEVDTEEEVDLNLHFTTDTENGLAGIEDSRSARYNAEQVAKTVQARIESNKTSQSIGGTHSRSIYMRDPNKKNSVFIGNLTWWTTDMDVLSAVREAGLGEVKSLKFYDNRTNGQSKGFTMVELTSEAVALGAPDKLQMITVHGRKLVAAYAGRMSVAQFEAKSSGKAVPDKQPLVGNKPQTSLTGKNPPLYPRPPLASVMGGLPPPILPPTLVPPELPFNPAFPAAALPRPPPLPPAAFDPSALAAAAALNSQKPGGAHLNPAFLQDQMMQGNNVAEIFAKAFQGPTSRPSDEEIADANQRNRAISSSAISRAMSDANAGDYESAIETLKMAITLIKQSITAGSESCQILIQSLVDCLRGVEHQASGSK
ncbi:PREDICTED: cleavage and polyadenylation specificity factor subunit 6-like [Amphimedon queenslandica]|uniref:RRM domain-containing protein n=1 Tax=Amphimedon queenslandica TaxID=400682 RepID=A0AAN0J1K2_AMPQE|nr:PREDICTED: cleavage and polyadenylation specificity factor subunit 6-like [Amphimedon queenslandica]|eukprot:XP_019850622.1 PREDICTED: cleavage and polyadenylation specificity factor subunit 6-like [Amphimedon queenslandica]